MRRRAIRKIESFFPKALVKRNRLGVISGTFRNNSDVPFFN